MLQIVLLRNLIPVLFSFTFTSAFISQELYKRDTYENGLYTRDEWDVYARDIDAL